MKQEIENQKDTDKNQLNNLHVGDDNSRLISEAILNDNLLQQLIAKKSEVYWLVTTAVSLKDGQIETVLIDESNHPILHSLNDLIEHRIEQIKQSFR